MRVPHPLHYRHERQALAVCLHADGLTLVERALQNLERERVLQFTLDGALERTRAVSRVPALTGEERFGRRALPLITDP